MRFFFRGCDRTTGKPLEGHVEATHQEVAYQLLSDHGIVTESLREDPKPLNVSPEVPAIAQFAEALDSALDSSSSQVPFDDLTEKYRGKKVWVIDRDKIRNRVARVVDTTLAASEANSESGTTARERVANAISGLFHDTRNIASQHSAESVAQMRAMVAAAGNNAGAQVTTDGLAEQIGRLTGVVEQAESLIAAMSAALRNVESGGRPRRQALAPVRTGPSMNAEQNAALHEIFQSNLELRRAMANPARPTPANASAPS